LVVLTGVIAGHAVGKYRGRDVYSVLWRVAGRGFLGLALVSGAVGYFYFDSFSVPSLEASAKYRPPWYLRASFNG
jgi:hypothetical protein